MKSILVAGSICLAVVLLCFVAPPQTPEQRVKDYFQASFQDFNQDLRHLCELLAAGAGEKSLRENFDSCRASYKRIEPLLEYYYELDVAKFNGPAIDFIEEEDPNAYREPRGLQMIESFLYPSYQTQDRQRLLSYVTRLADLSEGLAQNAATGFEPGTHVPEAIMEELYRIITLGITGFDTPLSGKAIVEAQSSLEGLGKMLSFYSQQPGIANNAFLKQQRLIALAIAYLRTNENFESFDRMTFIRLYINPLCEALARQRQAMGDRDNPMRHSLIKKVSTLFAENSLRRDAYFFDDTLTQARVNLGRKLFNEPALSVTGKRSCASCHQASKAFTDGQPRALELDGHTVLPRNTPTLFNAAFQHNLFYDSRQASLDQLINEVLSNSREMNVAPDASMKQLDGKKEYQKLYTAAYPHTGGKLSPKYLVNAISMYLRTLVSYNSRFDKHMRGAATLTKEEIAGFNLFTGKARCATCHFMPLFNGSKPATFFYQESEVIGVPATNDSLHAHADKDPGRYKVLPKEFLLRSFKTSTLRNIAITAPYMHNGIFPDLKSVLRFYNKGGGAGLGLAVENQTLPPEPLNLTGPEEDQIIAFLKTLTDTVSYRKAIHR